MQFFTDDYDYDYETGEKNIVGTRFSTLLWEDENYDFQEKIFYITNK